MIYRTLKLNDGWDLATDGSGRIAVLSGAEAAAQSVANAARLFRGEAWYAAEKGIPYFEEFLGGASAAGAYGARLRKAALGVAGVRDAAVSVRSGDNRAVTGEIKITLEDGEETNVNV